MRRSRHGRNYEWRVDLAPAGSPKEAWRPYPDAEQLRLEEAYAKREEKAEVPLTIGSVPYVVRFTTPLNWAKRGDEFWIQQRRDDHHIWRHVRRVRVRKPAPARGSIASSSSNVQPLPAAGGSPGARAGGLSGAARTMHPMCPTIDLLFEPGASDVDDLGSLTGFALLSNFAPDDLLKRCVKALPDASAAARSSGPHYAGGADHRSTIVWTPETETHHKNFWTAMTLPEEPHRTWAWHRIKKMGALFGSERGGAGQSSSASPAAYADGERSDATHLHVAKTPDAWIDLGRHLTRALDVRGSAGGSIHLLRDYVLLHCQASRVQPGGEIHKHVDKTLYGELIVTVVLEGESTLSMWNQRGSSLEHETELAPGDA